ncbi:unnamed protein product (mitochondrion) [Plasmodiophora brassicae]|uniref:Autophagy-related protein 9 n=1 Tax=Plasmodiophora brassicae TaxID=37360 RepID=A0A3P3YEA1_PLABS|nr:unnamed protein product [Plasmodiophora brassicae]
MLSGDDEHGRLSPLLAFDSEQLVATSHRQWAAVQNLDTFFQKISRRPWGFWRMTLSRIVSLLTLSFTILFSTFLLLYVDWNEVLNCHTRRSCAKIIGIRQDALKNVSFGDAVVIAYFVVFSLYWLWNLTSFLYGLRDGFEMRAFYNTKLNITDDALQTMEWADIVTRLEQLQRSFKISIIKDHDALDISNRILRRDNYFIAMVNCNILDLSIPFLTKELHVPPILGKSLEWNIRFCVLNSMFHDETFTIPESFFREPERLRRLLVRMACANLILMPFILIFMIIFFFLKNAEELHSRRSYLGPRQWSSLAQWMFREFNEVPHVFKARLNASHEDALAYISQFPPGAISILAQFVAYVSGAIIAVLLLLTASDTALVMDIQILGHSLVYYLVAFTALLAASRSLVATRRPNQDFGVLMSNVFRHTHYMSTLWQEQPQSSIVRREFSRLYPFKVIAFLQEVLCVLTTPLVLGVTLPATVDRVIGFVQQHTVRLPGVGDVCDFATYDFSMFSETRARSSDTAANIAGSIRKVEKSLVSFSMTHPSWCPNRRCVELLSELADQAEPLQQEPEPSQGRTDAAALDSPRHHQHVPLSPDASDLSESTRALALNVSQIVFSGPSSMSHRLDMQAAMMRSIVRTDREDDATRSVV